MCRFTKKYKLRTSEQKFFYLHSLNQAKKNRKAFQRTLPLDPSPTELLEHFERKRNDTLTTFTGKYVHSCTQLYSIHSIKKYNFGVQNVPNTI